MSNEVVSHPLYKNLAFICIYNIAVCINLDFLEDIDFTDPKGLLKETGNSLRYVKIDVKKTQTKNKSQH